MNALQHPTDESLLAYRLGKTIPPEIEGLAKHLEACSECQQRVAAISVGLSGTPDPNGSLSALSRAVAAPKPLPAADVPAEFASLTGYVDVRELGKGGMGVVYLARNKLLDREEVLKVVGRQLLEKPGAKERFLQEIRSAAKLQHANVVAAYSAYEVGESLIFAMEYVPGEDLAQVVKTLGAQPVPRACFYISHAALGLQHALDRGMVHRDIKPGNLILTKQNGKSIVKILDFGLAKATSEKALDSALTGDGKMLGTPDYMAPEQSLDAAKADIRADIYSLGCSLHYLLTAGPPFRAGSLYELLQKHHTETPQALDALRPDVPPELTAVVRKMMAKKAEQRYQTPKEVVEALAPFVKAKPGTAPATPATAPSGTAKVVARAVTPAMAVPAMVKLIAVADKSATFSDLNASTTKVDRKVPAPVGDDVFDDIEDAPEARRRPWLWPLVGVVMLFLAFGGGVAALWFGGVFDKKAEVAAKPTVAPTTAPTIKLTEPAPRLPNSATRAEKAKEAARDAALGRIDLLKGDAASTNSAVSGNAIRELAVLLLYDDFSVRRKAAAWFANTPIDTDAVVATIRRATNDPDIDVRLSALKAMELHDQRIALAAAKAREQALASIDNSTKDTSNLDAAVRAKALNELAIALRHNDIAVRRKAAAAIAGLDIDNEPIIDAIRSAAKDSDAEVQKNAQIALKTFDKFMAIKMQKTKEAALASVKANADDSASTDAATRRNGILGLAAAMRSSDVQIRRMAMAGLCSISVDDDTAAAAIKSGTRDSDPEVSKMAKVASEAFEKRLAGAFEPLLKRLKSTKQADQIAALNEIAVLGEKAQALSPAVGKAMLSPIAAVKDAALNCFEKIDPICHKFLVVALFDEFPQKRYAAAEKLGKMGTDALGAVDPLKFAYQQSLTVKPAFGVVTPNYSALVALAKIAPADALVVREVLLIAGKPYDGSRFRYNDERAIGLGCIDIIACKPEQKLKALISALDDPVHRLAVIKRIAAMGADGKPALKALEALKTDANAEVRAAAASAVESLKTQ